MLLALYITWLNLAGSTLLCSLHPSRVGMLYNSEFFLVMPKIVLVVAVVVMSYDPVANKG